MNALVVVCALLAQTAGAGLTVNDAVEEALARHPAAAAADAHVRVAAAQLAEARAGWMPRVDITESVTRSNNPVFVFGSLLEQGAFAQQHFDPAFLNDPEPFTSHRAAITARLPLFDRFHTSTTTAQARNAAARADAEVEEARQRIRADVIARYYGVVVAEEKLAFAKETVRAAEADVQFTRDRYEQGFVVESDALAADVHLAMLRQREIAAGGELAVARAALATSLQRSPAEPIVIDASLPDVRAGDVPLETALTTAIARRAPVRSAATAVADAEQRLRSTRAMMLPRLDAFGSFSGSGSTLGDRNTDHAAGVLLTFELFDRARPARVAAARAGIDAARAAATMSRDAVTMEVIGAWHRLRSARESVNVATSGASAAEVAARIVRDRYGEGLTTITEHLRAQTALVQARFELLAARYETIVAHSELLRATGDLDDVQPFL